MPLVSSNQLSRQRFPRSCPKALCLNLIILTFKQISIPIPKSLLYSSGSWIHAKFPQNIIWVLNFHLLQVLANESFKNTKMYLTFRSVFQAVQVLFFVIANDKFIAAFFIRWFVELFHSLVKMFYSTSSTELFVLRLPGFE